MHWVDSAELRKQLSDVNKAHHRKASVITPRWGVQSIHHSPFTIHHAPFTVHPQCMYSVPPDWTGLRG